eukprot:1462417-Prymnesium_polylepis.1
MPAAGHCGCARYATLAGRCGGVDMPLPRGDRLWHERSCGRRPCVLWANLCCGMRWRTCCAVGGAAHGKHERLRAHEQRRVAAAAVLLQRGELRLDAPLRFPRVRLRTSAWARGAG